MTNVRAPNKRLSAQTPYRPSTAVPFGVTDVELERVVTDAGELWLPAADEVIRPYMRNTGTWDSYVGQAILASMPKNRGMFLDVGAHVGYFSRLVARAYPTSEVHAFEPNPHIYGILALNAWQASERITTWPLALHNKKGLISMVEAQHNTGDTRCVERPDEATATVVAPAIKLDDLLPDIQADVVKIDVQGSEFAVIEGMMGLIRRSNDIKIIMEYSPSLLEGRSINPKSALQMLRGCGFNIAVIDKSKIFDAKDSEIISFAISGGTDTHIDILLYKS